MKKTNKIAKKIIETIGTLTAILLGSTIVLGLVWVVVWIIKSIAAM